MYTYVYIYSHEWELLANERFTQAAYSPKKKPQKKPCSESHIFSVFLALGVPRTLQSGPLKSLYHSATESTCIAKCIDFTNRF